MAAAAAAAAAAVAREPRITNVYTVSALATIGGLIQGFDVSSLAAIQSTHQYTAYFGDPGPVTTGAVNACMAGGSLLGSLLSSWTGDRHGRRDTLFLAAAVFVAGSALMCAVQSLPMLVAARVINGFAVGMLTSQASVYLAEISEPSCRGRLIALQQWMITWGILIMYFVSYGTSFVPGNASFRLPWGLQMVPALILLACLPLMPRSPRWLASQGRWDEVLTALLSLRNRGSSDIAHEMQQIRDRARLESEYRSTGWAELCTKRNFVRVHCAVFTHIWAQLSGSNALMYYIVYIFQMAGLTGEAALLSASIQYVVNVVMTVPALLLIDRLPRRCVMMGGALLMAAWLFATAGLMANYGRLIPEGSRRSPVVTWEVSAPGPSRAIIACSYLFVATYACTWGPLGWIYPAEVTPLHIRSKSVALATAFNWACTFSLTFFTPPAFQHIQWKTYVIFGAVCVAAFVHVFLFFQETQGKSLEEIDALFDDNVLAMRRVHGRNGRRSVETDTREALREGQVSFLRPGRGGSAASIGKAVYGQRQVRKNFVTSKLNTG